MKKKLTLLLLVLICLAALSGCGCEHEWAEADCVNPRHCTLCEETEGNPLGHIWMAATCDTPKTCEVCTATEGDPKGHSWVKASCEEAKNCTLCHLTEGEPLGHAWLEATTDVPKTCETCAVTEGDKITTDPRFTTAQTMDIQGKWACTLSITGEMMQIPDFPSTLDCQFILDFQNDGTLTFSFAIANEDAFMEAMVEYTLNQTYAELAAQGFSQDQVDSLMLSIYGMSTEDYVREELSKMDFNALFNSILSTLNIGGVYYVEDGILYTGKNWSGPMEADNYTLEGDTLTIPSFSQEMGTDTPLTRVTEE